MSRVLHIIIHCHHPAFTKRIPLYCDVYGHVIRIYGWWPPRQTLITLSTQSRIKFDQRTLFARWPLWTPHEHGQSRRHSTFATTFTQHRYVGPTIRQYERHGWPYNRLYATVLWIRVRSSSVETTYSTTLFGQWLQRLPKRQRVAVTKGHSLRNGRHLPAGNIAYDVTSDVVRGNTCSDHKTVPRDNSTVDQRIIIQFTWHISNISLLSFFSNSLIVPYRRTDSWQAKHSIL